MSQLIALGFITSASALYGFVVAYYAFARSLLNQILWQVEYRARTWEVMPRMGPEKWMSSHIRFQTHLGLLLASASFAFIFSLAFNVVFLFFGNPLLLIGGAVSFIALVALAAGWFVYVGVKNYREGRSAQRDIPNVVRGFMRKHGQSGGPPGGGED